jgi:imidazoleglycerol-phosphate dehydratase
MRTSTLTRKTNETDIAASLNLDGTGVYAIDTGIGFLDHMLALFAVHGKFDLTLSCKGDLKTDGHHSVEDIGIVLGKLLTQLLGDKRGIARYAAQFIPMDEALVRCVIDVSGRPYLAYDVPCPTQKVGDFDSELAEEFFRAVSTYGLLTLHLDLLAGSNTHHIIEAAFKAFARALKGAVTVVGGDIPSSKGMLE